MKRFYFIFLFGLICVCCDYDEDKHITCIDKCINEMQNCKKLCEHEYIQGSEEINHCIDECNNEYNDCRKKCDT